MTSAEPALQGNASLMGSSRIAPQSRTKKGRKRIAEKAVPYLMIAPAMIIVGVFMIYPIVYMIYLGFFDWDMLSDKVFVGLDNYITMFTDKEFWQVVGNTFTFMIMMVPPCLIISLLLAVYLKKEHLHQQADSERDLLAQYRLACLHLLHLDVDDGFGHGPVQLPVGPFGNRSGQLAGG